MIMKLMWNQIHDKSNDLNKISDKSNNINKIDN